MQPISIIYIWWLTVFYITMKLYNIILYNIKSIGSDRKFLSIFWTFAVFFYNKCPAICILDDQQYSGQKQWTILMLLSWCWFTHKMVESAVISFPFLRWFHLKSHWHTIYIKKAVVRIFFKILNNIALQKLFFLFYAIANTIA